MAVSYPAGQIYARDQHYSHEYKHILRPDWESRELEGENP
jgi:hypothetical protein